VLRPAMPGFNTNGPIILLGLNWLNAKPVGTDDGGWDDVLSRAIRFTSSPRL